jgi:hypothetical protein
MNKCLAIASALLGMVRSLFSEPSETEIGARVSQVEARVAAGETGALNELTTLPGKYASPAFLAIYSP